MPSDKVTQALNLFENWVEAVSNHRPGSENIHEELDALKISMTVREAEDFHIALFANAYYEGDIEEVYNSPEFEGLTKPEIAAKIKEIFQTGTSRIEETNNTLQKQTRSLDRTLSDIEADNIRRRQLEALRNWQPTGPAN